MGWDIVGAYEKGLCACGSEVGEETWATLLRRNDMSAGWMGVHSVVG